MLIAFPRAGSRSLPGDGSGWSIESEATDRRLLSFALGGAVLLHIIVMLLPMPSPSEMPPPTVPVHEPPSITRHRLPPPPPPEPTVERVVLPRRRIPVPFTVPPPIEPDLEFRSQAISIDPASVTVPAVVGPVTAPPEPDSIYAPYAPGLTLPEALPGHEEPTYPPIAMRVGLEGVVVLKAVITKEGRVDSIRVIQERPSDVGFGEEAIAAVSQWLYSPGSIEGRPVAVELTVRVVFELNR